MGKPKEKRFTNARKRDLGDFIMRQLQERDPSLTVANVRKVCSHLYTRLRTKEGAAEFLEQKRLSGGSDQ